MYISDMKIYDFKAFQGENPYELKFSKHINCISGQNGVGKSTVLAILSNCGELRKKDGAQINGKIFRGEYSQLIKGDLDNDTSGKKCTLTFKNLPPNNDKENPFVEKLDFRATFQNASYTESHFKLVDGEESLYTKQNEKIEYKRYRLLPVRQKNRQTEKKLNWPVVYLGLTRLFPIGESESVTQSSIPEEILKQLHSDHKSILSSYDKYLESSQVGIADTSKKLGFGITTKDYSYLSNSSGQDNLGQILLAVYSFEKLQSEYSDYAGGILLIDEIDSTLHPAAQNNLIDFLLRKSQELDLQIVFTSHSQSLIEHLNFRRRNPENRKSIQVNYFNNATSQIIIKENPDNIFIKKNLYDTYAKISFRDKITIFTEDDVGEWLLKEILEIKNFKKLSSIQFNNTSIGWENLINLVKNDYHIFKDVIIFLDPDLSIAENQKKLNKFVSGTMYQHKVNTNNGKIFFLELEDYIEKIFWNFLSSLKPDHKFFLMPEIEEEQFTARSIQNNGPGSLSYESKSNEQEKIKTWFKENLHLVNKVFPFWYEEKKEEIDIFYQIFCSSFYNQLKKISGHA